MICNITCILPVLMLICYVVIITFFSSIQSVIIYVPSQQLQGQLQTKHSVDTSNYIMDKHNIKSKTNYKQALEEKHTDTEK
jgi:hypothetical protein